MIGAFPVVEVIIASFLIALTAALLFLIARRFLSSKYSSVVALIFAFAASAWSTASRALVQHAPSMLLISLTIFILIAAESREWLVQFAAIPVAFSYVIRPTDAILVVVITVYVLAEHRRVFLPYVFWALPVAAAFIAYNLWAFKSVLSSYYTLRPPLPHSAEAIGAVMQVMAANLISPSRGLFVFTPVFVFSVAGMIRALRSGWKHPLSGYLTALLILHWVSISLFVGFWWGGYSYGPRLFTDMVPILMLFLIPVMLEWQKAAWDWRPSRILFVLLVTISLFIHARGGLSLAPHKWNEYPVSVDRQPQRIWDWKDPQFLRGL